jgi:hypothetical protein
VTRRVVIALLLGLAACTGGGGDRVDTPAHERTPVGGDALLAALDQAREYHRAADVHVGKGELDMAIAQVRKVLEVRFPTGAGEAEDIQLDARARLGLLLVQTGRLDEAQAVAEQGIAAATRDSFFLANLHQVLGRVHEARAHGLLDPALARAELELALEAHATGQQINLRVQARLYKESMP